MAKIPPHLWPDGKHKHWDTLDAGDRANILKMIGAGASNWDIVCVYGDVTVGTIAAVRANLNR